MNAYTFRRTDPYRDQVNRHFGTRAQHTISFRDRYIYLSTELSSMLGLDTNSHVAFTYDEDKPENIYIRPADFTDDTRDIQHSLSGVGRGKKILRCYNKSVVKHVLQQAKATTSCTCYVARKATDINGKNHFQIMVSCPIKRK